ncbi:MAG: hypothetical protein NC548_34680 [Lachnospiraceae bacterium]|nr:hypothetical protein [Lachnospiraceae bacterium]
MDGKMYELETDVHDSCEFCDLAKVCWQYWQGENAQPCICFGKDGVVFKLKQLIIKRDDKFTFGKFKGKTVLEVIETDPRYVAWAIKNVEWFDIDDELKERLKESMSKQRHSCNFSHSQSHWSEEVYLAGQDAFGSIY